MNRFVPEKSQTARLPVLLQQFDGRLTRQLLLEPGQHGLGMTHGSLQAEQTCTSVCGYCSTGCGLRLHLRDGEAMGLTPETNYPVNMGMACPKGWEALRVLESNDRATTPMIRDPFGSLVPTDWNTALQEFCQRLKRTQAKFGAESVAFISTGQIACEEMAFLGALAKFGMGMRHGDGNTRQCMATAVAAYKESFGFDAPPYTYDDFEQSDCLVFIGANPCIAHPIMWERVLRNPNNPHVIAIDPRRTETGSAATQHIQLKPKSDLVLLYAITNVLIRRGYVDREFVETHTTGFEQLEQHVKRFSPSYTADVIGVSETEIEMVAEKIGRAEAASLWWTMGVNQSYEGVRTAQAIINIALLTGNIGRPGTGANSITGQCNAMGSRLWSNTTNLLGHRSFECEQDRQDVADLLGFDSARIPKQGSWSYDRILNGVENGEIRGLWLIATNPAHSWIDQNSFKRMIGKLDFLVVQDMYSTSETAQAADLVLPAAGWGEKNGTFINSERRYSVHKRVRRAPGQALADFQIFKAISHYWGCGEMFARWDSPEAVFEILKELSAGTPADITGIESYRQLDQFGGIQWPWPQRVARDQKPAQQRRLFEDGRFFTDDGKARLIVDEIAQAPEVVDDYFQFFLLTGRGSASQWHTQTRTAKSPILRQLYPEACYVEVNPCDAESLGIQHGAQVTLRSRRGEAAATACITPTIRQGQLFMPMHYEETNRLTLSHFDPISRQPSYKNCAVRIEATQD